MTSLKTLSFVVRDMQNLIIIIIIDLIWLVFLREFLPTLSSRHRSLIYSLLLLANYDWANHWDMVHVTPLVQRLWAMVLEFLEAFFLDLTYWGLL